MALERNQGPSKGQLRHVLILGLVMIVNLTPIWIIGSILIELIKSSPEEFGVSNLGVMSVTQFYPFVFVTSLCLSPILVTLFNTKIVIVAGVLWNAIYIASVTCPVSWTVIVTYTLTGVGDALVSVAAWRYLVMVSGDATILRNSGLLWAFQEARIVLGTTVVLFVFANDDADIGPIDESQKIPICVTFSGVALLGVICALFLRVSPSEIRKAQSNSETKEVGSASVTRTPDIGAVVFTKEMALLVIPIIYNGMTWRFIISLLPRSFGSAGIFSGKLSLVSRVATGSGEILSGLVVAAMGTRLSRAGNTKRLIFVGLCTQTVAFILIFISDRFLWTTSRSTSTLADIAMIASSLFLGFGDAWFNILVYSKIGRLFPHNSPQAFAILQLFCYAGVTVSSWYDLRTLLQIQLGILEILCILSSISYLLLETRSSRGSAVVRCLESQNREECPEEQEMIKYEGMQTRGKCFDGILNELK